MASSRIIMVMSILILIFLFGGLMVGFILQSQDVLEKQSGRITINDQATFAQLATHVSLRAYNCNDQGGGQWDAISSWKKWDDWRSYVTYAEHHSDKLSFDALRESTPSGVIQCSGTASSLPMTDASPIQGAANLASKTHWGNDQEGRYGRMKFRFNKTMWVGATTDQGTSHIGCYGVDTAGEEVTDMAILVADDNDPNWFHWKTDMDMNCQSIADPQELVDVNTDGDKHKGAMLTLTLITPNGDFKDDNSDSQEMELSTNIFGQGFDADLHYGSFKICKGATGYIQANTGGRDAALGIEGSSADDAANVHYNIQNVPGEHGEQVGGMAGTDNQIRLFAVINGADDC